MRETKVIELKDGTKVELYTYITGREAREITNVFLQGMKFQVGQDGKTQTNEMSASLMNQSQDKAIELLVVSVDGSKENCLAKVLDLPKEGFDVVMKEIEVLQNGLTAEKKTK